MLYAYSSVFDMLEPLATARLEGRCGRSFNGEGTIGCILEGWLPHSPSGGASTQPYLFSVDTSPQAGKIEFTARVFEAHSLDMN